LEAAVAFPTSHDTSTIVVLLGKKYEAEAITVTVDVGREEDLLGVEEWAYKLGANKHYPIDPRGVCRGIYN
jgi:argininosuccinate synthase